MAIQEQSDDAASNIAFCNKLVSGEPLHFQKDEPEAVRTIQAAWIEHAVGKQVKIDVSNAVIIGAFKLRYATLEEEISLVDCWFKDPADFSYTTFKRNLVLSGSTFEQGAVFHSANLEYDSQLIATYFLAGEVDFSDLHVKGVFLADRLRIGKDVEEVNFNRACFEKTGLFLKSIFEGSASFRGVRFGDQAAFQGAKFKKVSFNGAKIGQHALFRGEPGVNILGGTVFEGEVDFSGAYIGGQADFRGAVFKSTVSFNETRIDGGIVFRGEPERNIPATICEDEVDFVGTCVGNRADFQGAVFKKKVNFNGAKIDGPAAFNGESQGNLSAATFEGEANFRRAHISGHANFQGALFKHKVNFDLTQLSGGASFSGDLGLNLPTATFEGEVSFASARIGGQADFRGAVFKQKVSFNLAKIDGGAFFRHDPKQKLPAATFGAEADFIGTHFDGDGDFQGAVFKEKVNFSGAKINGRAFFNGNRELNLPAATFEGEADFTSAYFGREARFAGTIFKKVMFNGVKMSGSADFADAVFESEADFASAHFDRVVNFENAEFRNNVSFNVAIFDADAFFSRAVFKKNGQADFRGARFRSVVDFQGTIFEGETDFYAAHCDSLARFENVEFQKSVIFRGTSFKTVDFSASGRISENEEKEQFQGSVDLLGCTYERIQVDWQSLMRHVEPYDRQPYTQIEKVFRTAGEDREANKIYLMRQHRERKLKRERGEYSSWVFSWLYQKVANYGVRPIRLIFFSLMLLGMGMMFFQLPEAVSPKEQKLAAELSISTQLPPWDAFGVSLHQFLPVDVPMGSLWIPSDKPIEVKIPWSNRMLPFKLSPSTFATFFLRLAGWILVPLGVAALTGLLRVRP